MISFLSLEYFLVAARELDFTRAARKFRISRQSLSNHIPNLEKEFNVILLNRTPLLTLTCAGGASKTRARELLDLWDETYKEISDIKGFSTGQLSTGVSRTHGGAILPEILPTYQFQFLGIRFYLTEGGSSQLVSDLFHESIDLMTDLLPFTVENMEIVPICNEEILMIVPGDILEKACPGQIEEMKEKLRVTSDIQILEHCLFVLLKKGNRACTIADKIFEDTQMSPRIVSETENIGTVLILSDRDTRITFYPKMFVFPDPVSRFYRSAVPERSHLNLYFLDHARAHGVLEISYHKGRYMSRATHELTCIARERLGYALKE